MDLELSGQSVVVTGAGSNIGGSVALFDRGSVRASPIGRWCWSDRVDEFFECGEEAQVLMSGLGSKFVVSASQVLDECVTLDHDRRGAVGLESSHRSEPRLQSAMITLDTIVGVLLGVVEHIRDQLLDVGLQYLREVGDDLIWFPVGIEGTPEERSGRIHVPSWYDEDIDHLAVLVDGPVDLAPLAGDAHVGFVDEPPSSNAMSSVPCSVDEQRSEPLDPPVDGDVIDLDASLDEEFFDVSIRQSVGDTSGRPT